MRILLINPINNIQPIVIPNLGLGYIASSLRKTGNEVSILDCRKEKLKWEMFTRIVKAHRPDLIGFQAFTLDLESVKRSVELICQFMPNIPIVIGGPHVSVLPTETLRYIPGIKYGFIGESEESFPMLINLLNGDKIDKSSIPGLVYKQGRTIKHNLPRPPGDLDAIPFPAWDLIDPRSYPHTPHGVAVMKFPVAPITLTRGCPFPCTFCAAQTISGKKLRKRSIENVLEEMLLLNKWYGVKDFHIEDDNFSLDKKYVVTFCENILEKLPGIHWALPNGVRLDTLDEQVLRYMKKAGCYSFAVGIESGSQPILDHMKKKLTLELVKEKVALIRKVGIGVTGFFILGYPAETEFDILQTIKFAKKLQLNRADFSYFLPLPGTEAGNQVLETIKHSDLEWDAFQCYSGKKNYSPPGISSRQLTRLHRKAVLSFYLRPKIILGILREIRTLDHFKYFWEVGKIFLSG